MPVGGSYPPLTRPGSLRLPPGVALLPPGNRNRRAPTAWHGIVGTIEKEGAKPSSFLLPAEPRDRDHNPRSQNCGSQLRCGSFAYLLLYRPIGSGQKRVMLSCTAQGRGVAGPSGREVDERQRCRLWVAE